MKEKAALNRIKSDYTETTKNMSVSKSMLLGVKIAVAEGICRAGDIQDGMKLYEKILEDNPELKKELSVNLINTVRKSAEEMFENKCYTNALIQYNRLMHVTELSADEYRNTAICLAELGQKKTACEFLKIYQKTSNDKITSEYVVADLLFFNLGMIKEAISHLENYLKVEKENPLAFNTLGHLYSNCYKDKKLDEQLKCFTQAYKLKPNNRTYISNIAFTYNRMSKPKEAKQFYEKLMKLNPTSDDCFAYACFLIQNGDFENGYKMLTHRFQKEHGKKAVYPTILPSDKKIVYDADISDKVLLIHHEQGLGDSIMFSRFVKQISKSAKEVYFIVPNNLVELFKNSNLGAKIHSDMFDITELDYDYHVPIMDLPIVLKTSAKKLPYTDFYLKVKDTDIKAFRQKYINNNKKIKVGIAYRGFEKTDNPERDIPLEALSPLLDISEIELYSFQYDKDESILNRFSPDKEIKDLGKEFLNLYDTACGIKCMDFMVTSDNVIMNLSGALGVKTYGVFNKYADYRWFKLNGEDVGWYKSVKPFCAETMDDWGNSVEKIIEAVKSDISRF